MDFILSRGDFDSATYRRGDIEGGALLGDPRTRLFCMTREGAFAVENNGGGLALWSSRSGAGEWPTWIEAISPQDLWFMGHDDTGAPLVVAVVPPGDPVDDFDLHGLKWEHLMTIGADLTDPQESLVATQATALIAWQSTTRFCSRCGGSLVSGSAGWTASCEGCGQTEYPRMDPAMIVAVVDDRDRLLLVHNIEWVDKRMSLPAGYVDAGEIPERTVVREIREEVGLEVENITYLGSQPWPRPRSLMLAYRATLSERGQREPLPDGIEVDQARFFTREELARAVSNGHVVLPGRTAVARTIIRLWESGDL